MCWLWRVCKWVGARLADKEATAVVMSIISGPRQIYVEQGEDPHHTEGRHREVREREADEQEGMRTGERGGRERRCRSIQMRVGVVDKEKLQRMHVSLSLSLVVSHTLEGAAKRAQQLKRKAAAAHRQHSERLVDLYLPVSLRASREDFTPKTRAALLDTT